MKIVVVGDTGLIGSKLVSMRTLRGPARDPLKTYPVTVEGDVGRFEVPLAQAVQGA